MVDEVHNLNSNSNGFVKTKMSPDLNGMHSDYNMKSSCTGMDPDMGVFAVEYPQKPDFNNDNETETIWPESSKSEDKPLVVVLLGWAGATDKHLSKYSDLYVQRGCIIVRYISPPNVVMFHHDKFPKLTSNLIQKMKDFGLDSHPMFFHLFSNGGGFTYSFLLAELTVLGHPFDIRGTICDSAPAPRELTSYYRALMYIFQSYGSFRHFMGFCMCVLLVLSVFWVHMKNAWHFCIKGDVIGFEIGHPSHNWLGRFSQFRRHNFLFIYSDADDIIRSHQVEKFANFMEAQDNNVKYLKFKDSPHVQHYRTYPKMYRDTIVKFIREVMNNGENKTHFPTQY